MFALPLIVTLLLVPAPLLGELEASGASKRDLEKAAKPLLAYFEALGVDDRGEQAEQLEKIEGAIAKAHKKARTDKPTTAYLADWDQALELAKPISREIKGLVGKGLQSYAFVEPYDQTRVAVLISLPKDYGKTDGFHPVVVGLKPALGASGSDLVDQATAHAQALYGDLLDTHIVFVPLGPEEGEGRSAEASEVQDGWMTDEGLYAFFTGFRVLLEQVRFDRSRVVLDGWGDAGLEAMKLATSAPSFFAGVINRGGDAYQDGMILENLFGQSVLYVRDGGSADRELGPLDGGGVDGVDLTVVETAGSALEPDAELAQATESWLAGVVKDLAPTEIRYKLGDIRFQAVNWCKASVINKRTTARPDDKDFPRIQARIDRGSNTISIETVNVLELQVYLSDALVDMSKTVIIEVNGEEAWRRPPRATARTLLENRYYNDSGDYGLYTDRALLEDIDPNVPGRDG